MKTQKLSLKNVKNVLSREEMKKIMAGSGPNTGCTGCGGGGGCYDAYEPCAYQCPCGGPCINGSC